MDHSSSAANIALDHVNSNSCEVCEATVEILAKLLSNPDVSQEIVNAVGKVCHFLPTSMKGKVSVSKTAIRRIEQSKSLLL